MVGDGYQGTTDKDNDCVPPFPEQRRACIFGARTQRAWIHSPGIQGASHGGTEVLVEEVGVEEWSHSFGV